MAKNVFWAKLNFIKTCQKVVSNIIFVKFFLLQYILMLLLVIESAPPLPTPPPCRTSYIYTTAAFIPRTQTQFDLDKISRSTHRIPRKVHNARKALLQLCKYFGIMARLGYIVLQDAINRNPPSVGTSLQFDNMWS